MNQALGKTPPNKYLQQMQNKRKNEEGPEKNSNRKEWT